MPRVMHYRLAPYCAGSGQFRTACDLVVMNTESTRDREAVTCPGCGPGKVHEAQRSLMWEQRRARWAAWKKEHGK